MTTDAMVYVPGATEGSTQWKAQRLQVVNWGGFEGHHTVTFDPGATLLSGPSGSGKSTLLDAYLALMMPSDVPFNGASNSGAGRARGNEQRNLLSYLRGQIDTTSDASGREKPKVLRGQEAPTWGAVAMTFVNDHGQLFTAARVYLAHPTHQSASDITHRMVTFDGFLDLPDLHPLSARGFAPKELKAAFSGLATHDSYAAFAAILHVKLGIGDGGDGAKALRLIARIQAGHQIRTVDSLYKAMVLEPPETFAAADNALTHFDALESAYTAMQDEQVKVDLLDKIGDHHARLTAARDTIERVDTYALTSPGDSPFTLWAHQRRDALLERAVDDNADARTAVKVAVEATKVTVATCRAAMITAQDEHRAAGGGDLTRLAQEIDDAEADLTERTNRLARFAAGAHAANLTVDRREDFAAAQEAAGQFLTAFPDRDQALTSRRDDLVEAARTVGAELGEVSAEHTSMAGRRTTIPRWLDELRGDVIAATGWSAADLPFLAELVDVPDHERSWRTAIEVVLRSQATVMLVPAGRMEQLSARIDSLSWTRRLRFKAVPLHVRAEADRDPSKVAGKLIYAEDSAFIGWVKEHLSQSSRNFLCVPGPDGLGGPGPRVTLAGQTRNGPDGSHGRDSAAHILGFDNTERLAELAGDVTRLRAEFAAAKARVTQVEDEQVALRALKDAHTLVAATVFADIDVWSVAARIADLSTTRDQILASDDRLRDLAALVQQREKDHSVAQFNHHTAENQLKELTAAWERLVDEQDRVGRELARMTGAQQVRLTEAQAAHLDEQLRAVTGTMTDVAEFDRQLPQLSGRLLQAAQHARNEETAATGALEATFRAYKAQFDDPNLGVSVASYPDYAAILDRIRTTGLHTRRAEWRDRLMAWSGEDLVPLSKSLDAALVEIDARLEPVNKILGGLPFGPAGDRLRIQMRRLTPEHVTRFRRDLRRWSAAATRPTGDEEMEAKFRALQRFMGRLRNPADPRCDPKVADRDELLDVRRHVEITAQRYSTAGELLATHSHLGGKSGGESQELIAFIVGAALRFQLGDEERARPRFAPVMLDEAFIKADAQFAGRAVQAWQGLGFQMIVGAPLDKVTALERYMDQIVSVTKNPATSYSVTHSIRGAE